VGGWVAAVGTTEWRELRGRIPWYGTLANHTGLALPAILGGLVRVVYSTNTESPERTFLDLASAMTAGAIIFSGNVLLASVLVALRTRQSVYAVLGGDARGTAIHAFALAPLAWLMAMMYWHVAWFSSLLFGLPLYTTRLAYGRFVELREMFTQT